MHWRHLNAHEIWLEKLFHTRPAKSFIKLIGVMAKKVLHCFKKKNDKICRLKIWFSAWEKFCYNSICSLQHFPSWWYYFEAFFDPVLSKKVLAGEAKYSLKCFFTTNALIWPYLPLWLWSLDRSPFKWIWHLVWLCTWNVSQLFLWN